MSQATAKIRLDGRSEPPDTYGIIIPLPESIENIPEQLIDRDANARYFTI